MGAKTSTLPTDAALQCTGTTQQTPKIKQAQALHHVGHGETVTVQMIRAATDIHPCSDEAAHVSHCPNMQLLYIIQLHTNLPASNPLYKPMSTFSLLSSGLQKFSTQACRSLLPCCLPAGTGTMSFNSRFFTGKFTRVGFFSVKKLFLLNRFMCSAMNRGNRVRRKRLRPARMSSDMLLSLNFAIMLKMGICAHTYIEHMLMCHQSAYQKQGKAQNIRITDGCLVILVACWTDIGGSYTVLVDRNIRCPVLPRH